MILVAKGTAKKATGKTGIARRAERGGEFVQPFDTIKNPGKSKITGGCSGVVMQNPVPAGYAYGLHWRRNGQTGTGSYKSVEDALAWCDLYGCDYGTVNDGASVVAHYPADYRRAKNVQQNPSQHPDSQWRKNYNDGFRGSQHPDSQWRKNYNDGFRAGRADRSMGTTSEYAMLSHAPGLPGYSQGYGDGNKGLQFDAGAAWPMKGPDYSQPLYNLQRTRAKKRIDDGPDPGEDWRERQWHGQDPDA
jgi:hypothetical protein